MGGKIPFDETIFTEPFSDDDAYWLGFILADGCVNKYQLSIGLNKKDYGHLEKFRQFIKSPDRKISYIPRDNGYVIAVGSIKLCKRLLDIGITPKKSLTAKVLTGFEMNTHFWRGLIDGDGFIGLGNVHGKFYPHIYLSGTKNIVEGFINFIEVNFPCTRSNFPKPQRIIVNGNEHFKYTVGGKRALKIMNLLYSSGISLDRKKEKAVAMSKI